MLSTNKKNWFFLTTLFFLIPVYGADKPKSVEKQALNVHYLNAVEASKFKNQQGSKALLLDIRTPSELVFVGSPTAMDVNIPLITLDYTHWDKTTSAYKKVLNQNFVSDVTSYVTNKKLTKNSPIILLCRSGKRSAKAANLLSLAGYTHLFTVVDGFEGDKQKIGSNKGKRVVNGWKNSGLPWTYKLEREHFVLSH
jgi:rhodanese-related sulfurtransferase